MINIQKATLEDFEKIYNSYMLKQFPDSELKKFDDFVMLLSCREYCYNLYLALNNSETVGYVFLFEGEKFLWVDYIAVLPEFYSKGYGHKVIEAVKNKFDSVKGIYFEVEKPDTKDVNTLRRIKFYNSCGVKKLDCEYFYPAGDKMLPMDLYFLPVKVEHPSKIEIRNNITEVFTKLHFMCTSATKILETNFN